MAYVNVKDWSVEQVTDWLKGLDNVILQYNISFLNNGVTGYQLLNLRADDLEHLGVKTLGHQEIILEAVEHLRNFHFELDKENLQTLALKLSCVSNSLYKELLLVDDDSDVVQTQVMSDVHNIITAIKPLVHWLDRSPFVGDKEYIDNKYNLLQLGIEMATSAHRGIFSEKPVRTIRGICEKLVKIAEHIMQEIMDPMILQPASLDLATLKKKEQELGFFILPNNHAIHQIAEIKHGSPAHATSKIEEGDEIVQVNYQTVVGWQRKKVELILQEAPPEIVLTLKKRPRHTKVYGQIYMKPYRLPSKKRYEQDFSSRWFEHFEHNRSPRLLDFVEIPIIPTITITKPKNQSDVEIESSSSDSEPPDSPLDFDSHAYPLKPRPILQRRNTITGATPTNKRPYPSIDQYWEFITKKNPTSSSSYVISDTNFEGDFLRDKSSSCTVGPDVNLRPTTVIGITLSNLRKNDVRPKRRVNFEEETIKKTESAKGAVLETPGLGEEKSVSVNNLASLDNEDISFIDEGRDLTDRTSMAPQGQKKGDNSPYETIKKYDDETPPPLVKPRVNKPMIKAKPAVPPRTTPRIIRGKLEKSLSAPTSDLHEESTCRDDIVKEQNLLLARLQPSVETVNPLIQLNQPETSDVSLVRKVPPKPPPRNFMETAPLPKSVHPAETAKPPVNEPSKLILESPEIRKIERCLEASQGDAEARNFDPKLVSTPLSRCRSDSKGDLSIYKPTTPSYEMSRNVGGEKKVSPTNSIVKAMIKGKNGKRKNILITRRRKVGVSELSGVAEIQGCLFQRLRNKQTQNVHWEKRWFVLSGNCLYGFRTKEDGKAACLIFLSGFTVAVASEVKSRSNAFKVYHTGTVFYFSAEDQDSLQSWIDLIRAATLHNGEGKHQDSNLYSETDDSDIEKSKLVPEKTDSLKKFGSLKKFSSKKPISESSQGGSTSLDRKWFFNKSGSNSKNSLPVPTAQFRSYRKIRSAEPQSSVTTGNFTSHVSLFGNQPQNVSVPNLAMEATQKQPELSNLPRKITTNYIHASNPSLCSSLTDFPGKGHVKACAENLLGFVTLEELMIRQTEEKKLNPHHMAEEIAKNLHLVKPDVVYGEVPVRQKNSEGSLTVSTISVGSSKSGRTLLHEEGRDSGSSCFGRRLGSLKKNQDRTEELPDERAMYHKSNKGNAQKISRSLPRAHHRSERLDTASDAEPPPSPLTLGDNCPEMIYCPQTVSTDVHCALNRTLYDTMSSDVQKKGTFKLKKQPSARVHNSSVSKVKLKSAMQYTPMSLPLTQDPKSKPKFAFELNLDEKSCKSNKLKQMFGNKPDGKKERTFLGSPKARRKYDHSDWFTHPQGHYTEMSFQTDVPPPMAELLPINTNLQAAEYPDLEYPPVFEPETYSLANPQSNIFRKPKQ